MIFTVVSFTLNATFKLTRRNHRVTFDDHFRRTISHKRDTIVSWVIWDFLKNFLPFFCFVLLNLFLPFSRYLIHVFLTPAKSSLAFIRECQKMRFVLQSLLVWLRTTNMAAVTLHENDPWQNTISLTYQIKYLLRKKKNYEHHFTWLANFLIRQWKRQ